MIRTAALLAWRGARRERRRAAVSLACGWLVMTLLLAAVATPGVARAMRDVTAATMSQKGVSADQVSAAAVFTEEGFRGQTVVVHRVADARTDLRYPGVPSLPRPGTMLVSPAMEEALAVDPEVRRRYRAAVIGQLPQEAVQGPRELRALVGTTRAEVLTRGGGPITSFDTAAAQDIRIPSVVQVGAPALAVMGSLPLLWLLWIVTGVGATSRSRRRAGMDLMGFPRWVGWAAGAVEGAAVGVVSVLLAVGTFLWAGPRLGPHMPFGHGAWAADVRLPPGPSAAVAGVLVLMVTAFGALAARRAGHVGAPPRRRASPRLMPTALGAVGVLAAGLSLWWPAADAVDTRLGLLVAAFVLLGAAVVTGGLRVGCRIGRWFTGSATPWRLVGGAAAREQRGWASGVSGALALLVMVSGVLMSLFPLLGAADSQDRARAVEALGEHTIVVSTTGVGAGGVSAPGVAPEAMVINRADGTGGMTSAVRCAGMELRLESGTMPCGPEAIPALRDALRGLGYELAPGASSVSPGTGVTYGPDAAKETGTTEVIAIHQPEGAAAAESRRTALIAAQVPASHLMTIGEGLAEVRNATRPFLIATVASVAFCALVAVVSLLIALSAQVSGRGAALRNLRLMGMSLNDLVGGVCLQSVAAVVPTVMLAFAAGQVVAFVFIRLDQPGNATLPIAGSAGLAVVAALAAPVGGLAMRRTIERASDPAREQE